MRLNILLSLSLILLIGCSPKTIYVKSKCPYVLPLDIDIPTDNKGALNPSNAYKAIKALQYYGISTRRVQKLIKVNNESK